MAANLDENEVPTEQFRQAISANDSMMKKSREEILKFMSAPKNKSEWAYRVFEAQEKINYPRYIENVISHFQEHR